MQNLTTSLQAKIANNETIVVPYLMAGANGLDRLPAELQALAAGGAAAIEVGIPFSDPVADGPVIQQAGLAALQQQVTLAKIIAVLKNFDSPVPLILMGYYNPFQAFGLQQLIAELQETAVKGLIIPDLPYEHRDLLVPYLQGTDLALIPLVTLTSSRQRITTLVQEGAGFIYAVTVNGVTGTGKTYRQDLDEHLQFIRSVSEIPVLAGFGVSEKQQVERFCQSCDGVVVGSQVVRLLQEAPLAQTTAFIAELVT